MLIRGDTICSCKLRFQLLQKCTFAGIASFKHAELRLRALRGNVSGVPYGIQEYGLYV